MKKMKQAIFAVIFVCAMGFTAFSQTINETSQPAADTTTQPAEGTVGQTIEEAAALYNRAATALNNKDFQSSLRDMQSCITMCEQIATVEANELKAKAESGFFQGTYAYAMDLVKEKKFDEALPVLDQAEALAVKESQRGVANEEYITEVFRKISLSKSQILARKAKEAYDAGNFDETIRLASSAIQTKDDNTTAYFYRGRAYDKKGDLNNMELDFQKCVEIVKSNPKEAKVLENVNKSARSAYIKEAQKFIQSAQKLNEEKQAEKNEQLQQALTILNKIAPYGYDANTYYHLALVNNGLKQYNAALKAATDGLPLETKNQSNFYYMMGQAQEGLGNVEAACESYKMVTDGGYIKPALYQRDQVLKCKD